MKVRGMEDELHEKYDRTGRKKSVTITLRLPLI